MAMFIKFEENDTTYMGAPNISHLFFFLIDNRQCQSWDSFRDTFCQISRK